MKLRCQRGWPLLAWVWPTLADTFAAASRALRESGEAIMTAEPPMATCADHLRLAQVVLQMIGQEAPAWLAEEMRAVAEALASDALPGQQDQRATLSRALILLPDYLRGLVASDHYIDYRDQAPRSLLPLFNELRVSRGQPLLSPSEWFFPPLDAPLPGYVPGARVDTSEEQRRVVVAALRARFQQPMLGWLRGQESPLQLNAMREMLEMMGGQCLSLAGRRLWWIAASVLEGVELGALQAQIGEVRRLIGKVDRSIHRWLESGEQSLAEADATELSRQLLYLVAQARPETPRLRELRQIYRLDDWLTDQAGPRHAQLTVRVPLEPTAHSDVIQAAKQELERAKDALELLFRWRTAEAPPLDNALRAFSDLGSALEKLGLSRRGLDEQLRILEEIAARSRDPDPSTWLDVAIVLLQTEAMLDQPAERPRSEEERLVAAIMQESAIDAAAAADSLVAFTEAEGDPARLDQLPILMRRIAGAMQMLSAPRPAALAVAIGRFVETELLCGQGSPPGETIERLADGLTALSSYAELARDYQLGFECALEVGERSLAELGYALMASHSDGDGDMDQPPVRPVQLASSARSEGPPVPADPTADDAQGPGAHESTDGAAGWQDSVLSDLRDEVGFAIDTDRLNPRKSAQKGDAGLDAEVRAIFLQELQAAIDRLQASLPAWLAKSAQADTAAPLLRTVQELRATSLLLGAQELAEWAGKLMDLLRGVIEQRAPYASVHELIGQAAEALPSLQQAFSAEGEPSTAAQTLIDSAERLAVREIDPKHEQDETAASSVPSGRVPVDTALSDNGAATNHAADQSAAESRSNPSEVVASDTQVLAAFSDDAMPDEEPLLPAVDEVLLDILRSEVAQHLGTIRSSIRHLPQSERRVDDDLLRAVHTLHGVVAMVDIAPLIPLLSSLEGFLKQRKTLPSGAEDLLGDVADAVDQTVAQLGVEQPRLPPIDVLMARLGGLSDAPNQAGRSTQVHENAPRTAESPPVERGAVASDDHQRAGAASTENLHSEQERPDPPGIQPSKPSLRALGNQAASGAAESMMAARSSLMSRPADSGLISAPSLGDRRGDHRDGGVEPSKNSAGWDATVQRPDHPPDDPSTSGQGQGSRQDLSGDPPADGYGAGGAALQSDAEAPITPVDSDLLETFLEEAEEILDHADGELAAWRAQPAERTRIVSLQRDLHTLKGGARIVALSPIGDLCHAMETVLDRLANQAMALDREPIAALESGFDQLYAMLRRIGYTEPIERPTATIARLLALSGDGAGALGNRLAATGGRASDGLPAVATSSADPRLPEAFSGAEELPVSPEHLRIRADLVDNLVDLAGEAAIYQSRLDQQIGGYRFNLAELEQTVSRLRAQLRALEIETEAQIIARYQREHRDAGTASFDPLELDRYSQLQQYSRALAESVSDLVSLQSALNELTRQAEDLLAQQSRLGSSFRESLRHTRMLPFDTLMPNLRRTLRQAASDLGKQARLQVDGAHGEMDRHLLDQLKAPFEHMLRNAVAHGIETPTERLAAGKAAEGQVHIEVARESTEVVIQVSDDGRGLDREAIRSRAVEQGLLTKEAQVADAQWLPLITQPGFSTAGELTQLAGRGLGMDVVANQIRRLGGSLSVESTPGVGTTFIMRLPFTLEVVQAMVVRLGESQFAVPMTSVHGLAWIGSADLAALMAESLPYSEHAGESYPVVNLAKLLGLPPSCTADDVPLLLVRSGELRAAISVDALVGSWEIVVKPVGPQISLVPGILGATIMGDGAVLVILDLPSLVRHGESRCGSRAVQVADAADPRSSEAGTGRRPMVMVVDDSITMRKVTSRVLERQGFDVMTARDGIEALEKLATTIPDLMLLDVEMPRMDGYQLAGHLRSDARWVAVPVIMITSRSGEKHRLRALDLGIGDYLGKPYQENELVARIDYLLGLPPREKSYD